MTPAARRNLPKTLLRRDYALVLAAAGTKSPAAADHDDTAALWLRLLAVLPALAIFLAGLIKYSKGRIRASLLPIGWSLMLVCVCFLLIVEL